MANPSGRGRRPSPRTYPTTTCCRLSSVALRTASRTSRTCAPSASTIRERWRTLIAHLNEVLRVSVRGSFVINQRAARRVRPRRPQYECRCTSGQRLGRRLVPGDEVGDRFLGVSEASRPRLIERSPRPPGKSGSRGPAIGVEPAPGPGRHRPGCSRRAPSSSGGSPATGRLPSPDQDGKVLFGRRSCPKNAGVAG